MGLLALVALALLVLVAAALVRVSRGAVSASPPERAPGDDRWRERKILSGALVAFVHLVPIAAAVLTSAFVSRRMQAPDTFGEKVLGWIFLIAVSTAVLAVVDRAARRLLPLAALLKLSMLFPDRAPRRIAVARRSGGARKLKERLAYARAHGVGDEPEEAAEQILSLVAALHAHDRHTRGHSERVRVFADLLADELKLPTADRDRLRWAALLHDIGKLEVSPKILNHPGKPSDHQWHVLRRHPIEGAKLARPLESFLGEWASTIEQHHERWDGAGYPNGLRGEEISLGARIVGVADSYEVMTAVRPYKKKAMGATAARRELTRCAGAQFDPAIVRAFLNVSIGSLRWGIGPMSWLAEVPFIGWLPRVADGAAAFGGQAAGFVGAAASVAAVTTGGAVGTAEPAPLPAPAVATVDPGAPTQSSRKPVVLGNTITRPPAPVSAASTTTTTTTTTVVTNPAGRTPPGQMSTTSTTAAKKETGRTLPTIPTGEVVPGHARGR